MIPDVALKQPYAYDHDLKTRDGSLKCRDDKALQQFANDVDINTLVRRFGITDMIPQARQLADYGEFDLTVDLHSLMSQVKRGEQAFNELPAKLREEFNNDPLQFLGFIQDDKNLDRAVELGLVKKPSISSQAGSSPAAPTSDASASSASV